MFWLERHLKNKGKDNMKNFLSSKRFWAGLVALITGLGFIFTGEKNLADPAFLGEIIMTAIGFLQTIIALTSTDKVVLGFKK
uniref:Uncharacterized protein n=1 Tax=viral metagenome TaxID=1070528 RepID=A0A6H2A3R4_9ZZZZ